MRVKVYNGDNSKFLGLGNYVDDVVVYFIHMPDGSLRSTSNAEQPPVAEMVPEGAEVIKSEGNPKIVLDNGTVVYGCQVWWEPVVETVEIEDDKYDPWAFSKE
jgi:hypothetical protein